MKIYDVIQDKKIRDRDRELSYDDIINFAAKRYGMHRDEFEKNFPRCKKIYEQKIKWLKELKKLQDYLGKKRMGIIEKQKRKL